MIYPLCDQTVTVYRQENGKLLRQVSPGCFYRYSDQLSSQGDFHRPFLLIRPGSAPLLPGDRILEGVGPENPDWDSFLPETVAGLSVAAYATAHTFDGRVCHYEAGRK